MRKLIEGFDRRYLLGLSKMDDTHREFVAIVNAMGEADKADFIPLFEALTKHTKAHFSAEERLMEASAFPAIREHKDEHLRVLGELERFGQRVAAGAVLMGRAYVTQQLPKWFDLHTITMDSALAAHLKAKAE
jgi:hemerythrin